MSEILNKAGNGRDHQSVAAEAALSRAADLMEALVAAYALMAHADGEVAAAERQRMFSILRGNPAMSIFSRHDIAEEAAVHEANFRLDPEVAQQIAREKLLAVANRRDAVSTIIAACREIIPADGVAHPAEYRQLAEIKSMLGRPDEARLGRSWHDGGADDR
ncbi:TerB family tellurite resistance protein [Lichenihabitans sp. PAMC28606]|uniref:tellurite resistance TerB family protein n=1 Tax=Lichenihabitans sp. PAMC28606 TaxID=2880932 RepID=UPI001D0B4A67|nr:TerB family tellurite resistance protein [Lichenihabitans sp. PAMC28606]UDL94168.1 TerB family tellurite resistance protein [Lichenihabitans sp. PAMC28606]